MRLRPAARDDIPTLARIRATPEVYAYWRGGDDLVAAVEEDLAEPGTTALRDRARRCGHRLDPVAGGGGAGLPPRVDRHLPRPGAPAATGSAATRCAHWPDHLFTVHGHHRIEIDPAADNDAAIRAYSKVGFRPVGITRRSERGPDGTWHDGLLMDLRVEGLVADPPDAEAHASPHCAAPSSTGHGR